MPEYLEGDSVRLKQIVYNLVKNALKFTRKGSVKILAAFDSVADQLFVSVVDTGIGITQQEQLKIFDLFGKLNRTAD